MFTTLHRTTRESARDHGSSASALRAVPAGTASSTRPRAQGTGIVEDPAEGATAEARQPSQDRVPRHLTSSLDDRHLPTYAPTLMHEASFFPAVSSAMQSANSSAAAMRGRNLFVGIVQANTDREAAGLQGVWPNTAGSDGLSDDKEDIAGIPFRNSTDYFRTLFDTASMGKDGWAPYVVVDISTLKLSKDSDFCDWIVAANIQDEFDDVIPVLISANVDPSVLKTSFNGYDDTPIPFGSQVGRTKLPWCDDFVIVVRKGGAAEVIKRRYFTYSMLYKKQSFSAPGLKYLDVE